MPFKEVIAAGLFLVREALRSPNFKTGVSGWTINRDGSAEFNNVIVRGTITGSIFQSTNFVAGVSGFQLNGTTGTAEFNGNVTVNNGTITAGMIQTSATYPKALFVGSSGPYGDPGVFWYNNASDGSPGAIFMSPNYDLTMFGGADPGTTELSAGVLFEGIISNTDPASIFFSTNTNAGVTGPQSVDLSAELSLTSPVMRAYNNAVGGVLSTGSVTFTTIGSTTPAIASFPAPASGITVVNITARGNATATASAVYGFELRRDGGAATPNPFPPADARSAIVGSASPGTITVSRTIVCDHGQTTGNLEIEVFMRSSVAAQVINFRENDITVWNSP